jgi:hypothetical protein
MTNNFKENWKCTSNSNKMSPSLPHYGVPQAGYDVHYFIGVMSVRYKSPYVRRNELAATPSIPPPQDNYSSNIP